MKINKKYCCSSFLTYRTIIDEENSFSTKYYFRKKFVPYDREKVHNSLELYNSLKKQVELIPSDKKIALALSGGIDSAIIAKLLPKNSITYTFKCVVPGIEVIDETPMAKKYADECGLQNKIIEIFWEDFEKYSPILMKHKGAPIHSIEVQIYKAALQAKKDGCDILLFGESADVLYGGMNSLLSKDWTFGEFVDRYSFIKPYQVLRDYELILGPYKTYEQNGYIDIHGFISNVFFIEGLNSYINACQTAGINCLMPFSNTILGVPLDLKLVRLGKNKYLVREIFEKLYNGFDIPPKTPMPRPMNEWLANWEGPVRNEFWPHCTDNMTGDQKWLVWILEKWLDILDNEKN